VSERIVARIVWVVAALALVAAVFVVWREVGSGTAMEMAGAVAWVLLTPLLVLTGALIVSRQPDNIIGLLLMVPGLIFLATRVVDIIAGPLATSEAPDQLTVGLWIRVWFDSWSWVLLIFSLLHLMLVFPTGRLLSPRWRWVAVLEAGMILFMIFSATFAAEIGPLNIPAEDQWYVPNPIGFIPQTFYGWAFNLFFGAGLLLVTVSALLAMVIRFRKAAAVERQQIKVLLFAVTFFALVYIVTIMLDEEFEVGTVGDLLFVLSVMGIPVAIAVAVLRFHLYDLDRIIRRTLLYAVLTGLLVGIFALSVFLIQRVIGGFVGEDSALGIATSTLLIAALFNPLRRRLQHVIDRRLYRSKYDAQRVIDEFVATARNEPDMSLLSTDLLEVVDRTVQPSVQGLWIKGTETKQA
jgi:hypothetical protein